MLVKFAEICFHNGYEVWLHCGDESKIYNIDCKILKPYQKKKFHYITNLYEIFLIIKKLRKKRKELRVYSHHLTALFRTNDENAIAFIQDNESNFYPSPLRWLGNIFWQDYLNIKKKIYTNIELERDVQATFQKTETKGMPWLDSDFSYYGIGNHRKLKDRKYDFTFILRSGQYKGHLKTKNIALELAGRGFSVAVMNFTRTKILNRGIKEFKILQRENFLDILKDTKIYVCLSEREGLGLPNIEAILAGASVLSTKIPSFHYLHGVTSTCNELKFDYDLSEIINTCEHYIHLDISSRVQENAALAVKHKLVSSDTLWKAYLIEKLTNASSYP